jgi:uncharacterized protein
MRPLEPSLASSTGCWQVPEAALLLGAVFLCGVCFACSDSPPAGGGVRGERVVDHHPNGRKSAEGLMVDGARHGTWTTWDEQGNVHSQGEYVRGVKEGTWLEAFLDHERGEWLEARGPRVGGKRHGIWEVTTRRGQKVEQAAWKDDRLDGPVTRFHPGDRTREQGAHQNGRPHGPWTWWYEDGTKEREGELVDGHPVGVWRTWYASGEPMTEVDHDTGSFRRWTPDGVLTEGVDPALKSERVR